MALPLFRIYCDESCHLKNDGEDIMVLGAIWCPKDESNAIFHEIREIKIKHGLPQDYEIKWNKISKTKADFYLDLVDYYFSNRNLGFRAVVVQGKKNLNHEEYNQSHDDFYYKIYFRMLSVIFNPNKSYEIYIDIKDTNSNVKVQKLHQVICNSLYDFDRNLITRLQQVRSHEVELIQLADLLIGALSYLHRNISTSESKSRIVDRIKEKSRLSLTGNTLYQEKKMNLLIWNRAGGHTNAS